MRALFALVFAPLAIACGPSKVVIPPSDVTRVDVRPASGQGLFCPGDPFQIELLVQTKGGSTCSSTDRRLGCNGKSDAVIDPQVVRVQAWPATPVSGVDYTFTPDPNPLATAGTGLSLRGFLESGGQKSIEGHNTLKPVYQCLARQDFGGGRPSDYGAHGVPGPELHVFVTTLSTPYYANAALVRIEAPEYGVTRYAISSAADKPITIVSAGQDGAMGMPGAPGHEGHAGTSNSSECGRGGDGGTGSPGGMGGIGGDGGPGGMVHVHLDSANADALRDRVIVFNPGGDAGPGGPGGAGGAGGAAGSGGPSGQNCSGQSGSPGTRGADGPMGASGHPGPPGPPPTFDVGPRAVLFPKELPTLTQIEATPAAK